MNNLETAFVTRSKSLGIGPFTAASYIYSIFIASVAAFLHFNGELSSMLESAGLLLIVSLAAVVVFGAVYLYVKKIFAKFSPE